MSAGESVDVDLWSEKLRTPEALAYAVASLRAEFGHPDQRFGVYFIAGTDPRSALGRAVELERFGDSFDNDVPLMRELYGTFEDHGNTELIVVVDHEAGLPCGVIRTVRNTAEDGCRILNDLQKDGENGWGLTWDGIMSRAEFAATTPEEIIDIPTIAVAKAYQGARESAGTSKALYTGLLQRWRDSDALTWVCSLDRIPYILVQAVSNNVMHEFDGVEGQPYYGAEDTVPLWCNIREYETYLRHYHHENWEFLARGKGLESKYFFGFPQGEPTWEPLDAADFDLSRYTSQDG